MNINNHNNIFTPYYSTSFKNFDLMTKQYIITKPQHNFFIPFINDEQLNFTYIPFHKQNHLHQPKNRLFNSCIYTNSINGNNGCTDNNISLNKLYFLQNQNKHKNIIKYINNDINIFNK